MRPKIYFEIWGKLSSRHALPLNHENQDNFIAGFLSIRRLAKKHHRLAEMNCNGEGVIRGVHYYAGAIDAYARRTYGAGVRSAYLSGPDVEETIFDVESEKIETKIKAIAEKIGVRVEFQGDPRGVTVKVFLADKDLTDILWD